MWKMQSVSMFLENPSQLLGWCQMWENELEISFKEMKEQIKKKTRLLQKSANVEYKMQLPIDLYICFKINAQRAMQSNARAKASFINNDNDNSVITEVRLIFIADKIISGD